MLEAKMNKAEAEKKKEEERYGADDRIQGDGGHTEAC